MIRLRNYSSNEIKRAAAEADGEYTLLVLKPLAFEYVDTLRFMEIAKANNCLALYADFIENGKLCKVQDVGLGSVRDNFDFGPVMFVRTDVLVNYAKNCKQNYKAAGFYDFWLHLWRVGSDSFSEPIPEIIHIPEPLTAVSAVKESSDMEEQFSYVDPTNRRSQIEMEDVFSNFVDRIGCRVKPGKAVSHDGDFPVEASVIIPVKNRAKTIGDAIKSALNQSASFTYNILVVDNYSTDGTTEIIDSLAAEYSQVKIITPPPGQMIGGCWNAALDSEQCGRFAIQLDSDDVYSSPQTLQTIVNKFRDTHAAMVIGSYTLTDFDLNVIPPGIIDHREWTDENGMNNALRINGLGAPRAFFTPIARRIRFPNVSYGEDYAMALRICGQYRVARIFDSIYFCRRWGGNSDSNLSREAINANNSYKDWIRSNEIRFRIKYREC